jgi:hypothetical protein
MESPDHFREFSVLDNRPKKGKKRRPDRTPGDTLPAALLIR